MVFSLVPSIMVSADSDVIWSENFDGKTTANLKSQGYTIHDNDSRIVVENGIGVAKTSEGGSGFVFSNLSAKAEGLVRVLTSAMMIPHLKSRSHIQCTPGPSLRYLEVSLKCAKA